MSIDCKNTTVARMNNQKMSEPVGILNKDYFQNNFTLNTYFPKNHLQDYIEHYWLISWELPFGVSHQQDVIPHPNTHLTFLNNDSHIQGICKQKYSHTLSESGNIVGVKFKPAGFFSFAERAGVTLSSITDKVLDIKSVFNISDDLTEVEQRILKLDTATDKINYVDQLLFSNSLNVGENIKPDENIKTLNAIVADIAINKDLIKVTDVSGKYKIELRHLQRLFLKYIGVSVKWVINRYRMHEALTTVESYDPVIDPAQSPDWAKLALELGYYDQAHFIKDFKSIMGTTPKEHYSKLSSKKSLSSN